MRLLMWLALGVLVIFALRKKAQSAFQPTGRQQQGAAETDTGQADSVNSVTGNAETMVCCERCQLYIPASEAVLRNDKVFCCAAHADQP
ncbi:hypothetical protein EJG51_015605 [Undibacterium piscinae]|jgi:uncharacterized protein|uniref:Uncharacterized protein n=1 Tax=Undibacterium piscinae TaxID=2495591 RepID=A0A6M4A765_9BURK|nr:hypothetical protein EJG51_015605 [Undibacterium piscinae]